MSGRPIEDSIPSRDAIKDCEFDKFTKSILNKRVARTKNSNEVFGDIRIPISLGLVNGVELFNVKGYNDAIDASETADIIHHGGIHNFLTVSEFINIVSDSALDVTNIEITGLLEDFSSATEIKQLNGLTPVQTTNKFRIINHVRMLEAVNVGTILLTDDTGGTIQSSIGLDDVGIGLTDSRQVIFGVPLGKVALVVHAMGSLTAKAGATGTKEGLISLSTKKFDEPIFYLGDSITTRSDGSSFVIVDNNYPTLLEEKSYIKAEALSFKGDMRVTISLTLLLIDKAIFGLA